VFLKNRITLFSTNCSKMGLTVFVYPSIFFTHHMTTYAVHTHTYTRTSIILIFVHTTQVTVTITRRSYTTALSHARRTLADRTTAHHSVSKPTGVHKRTRYRPSPPKRSCRERRNYCPSNQFKKSVFILPLLPLYVFHAPTGFFY